MGYTTEFRGEFSLDFKDKSKREEVINLVNGLADTRRIKRDLSKIKHKLDKPIEEYGIEGEFYLSEEGFRGQDRDNSVINYNMPPSTQPGLWLQWIIDEEDDTLVWDQGEKFYNYIEWLYYLIDKIFEPNNVILNGTVEYRGEDWEDTGTITISNNTIETESKY